MPNPPAPAMEPVAEVVDPTDADFDDMSYRFIKCRLNFNPASGTPLYAESALASAQARVAELEAELANIANAERFKRLHFEDDTAFADWAQSRARFTL